MLDISVVIPVVKQDFLTETINSLSGQTQPPKQIIFIFDGVLPQPHILTSIKSGLPAAEIHILKKNIGKDDPAKTWAVGLQLVTCSWFHILGDDDYINENFYESMFLAIRRSECQKQPVIARGQLIIVNKYSSICDYGWPIPELESAGMVIYQRFMRDRPQSICENIFNTEFVRLNGGFPRYNLAFGADDTLIVRAALASGHIIGCAHAIAYWRVHDKSLSGQAWTTAHIHGMISSLVDIRKLVECQFDMSLPKPLVLHAIEAKRLRILRSYDHLRAKKMHLPSLLRLARNLLFRALNINRRVKVEEL
jgi:hypothetical protein